MCLTKTLLASVTLWAVAHCSSDVYKKLKGTSIIPIDFKEEKDTQNREDWSYEGWELFKAFLLSSNYALTDETMGNHAI